MGAHFYGKRIFMGVLFGESFYGESLFREPFWEKPFFMDQLLGKPLLWGVGWFFFGPPKMNFQSKEEVSSNYTFLMLIRLLILT